MLFRSTISDVIVTLCILHKLDTNPVWVFHPDGEHRSTSCEIDVDSALQADGRMAVRLYVS